MKRIAILSLSFIFTASISVEAVNQHYVVNKEPLLQSAFVKLPLGHVKPKGWLKDQLIIQSNGLTGHLDDFWPSLAKTAWKGMEGGEAWERGPYYLDGLVPLAYLLEDERLINKTKPWMEWILSSQQENGWFGPPQNNDRWPLAVAMKVLVSYYEATGDVRAMDVLENYFRYLKEHRPDWPNRDWRGVRAMENVVTAHWLYNRTGNKDILDVAHSIFWHSYDWTSYFLNFPYTGEVLDIGIHYGHPSHIVNLGMAVKYPGLWYRQSKDDTYKDAVYRGIASLEKHHGQVGGRFAGDEHLSGKHPSQGTELCGVVELMFSLENLVGLLGDTQLADRLELLAYNSLPGTCTPDFWAHQYDQQANQVLCTIDKRQWSTNGNQSNVYGLEPNYGCCTSNMHQGWPKLVKHLWMASHDQGLAATTYGPCEVTAKVADGQEVTIQEKTSYPFRGKITFVISTENPVSFPLHLRIPGWAEGAMIDVEGTQLTTKPGTFTQIKREWNDGDVVVLNLPMDLRFEHRYNNAVSIMRGPLYYSLKIKERFEKIKTYHDELPVHDWAIYPESDWNYALLLNPANPQQSFQVETNDISPIPFANDKPPVVLKAKGKQLPDWGMNLNSADAPPQSPVTSSEPETELELIPYGNTRLRITEFPYMKAD